tara:strand:- start:1424 stop:1639 length:216 start_codon:yes stop_codon:yes gene_type:complete
MNKEEATMISIPELAKRWKCSRHHIWNQVQDKEIPAIQVGKRWFISMMYVNEIETELNKSLLERQQTNGKI